MKIEIDKKDYEILLKHAYIGNWVYWIMSDAVSSKYKKEAAQWDRLIHKLLKHTDDPSVKINYKWENIFTDAFWDKMYEDLNQYEHYVVDDLTGIDMEQVEAELEAEENNPLFVK